MKKALIASLVVSLAAFSACSKKQTPENVETPAEQNAEQAAADNAQAAPAKDAMPELEITAAQWADANNEFGINMLRNIEGNAVVSPYSAQRAIGMILDGTKGDAADEIRTALSLPNAKNLSAAARTIEDRITAPIPEEDKNPNMDYPVVHIDNRVWVEKTMALEAAYVDKIKAGYAASPAQVDFVGAPDAARIAINDDIAKTTEDKIKDIIPDGAITPLTRLVLTNAVYFKASWFNGFDEKATDKQTFHAVGGDVQVDMMHHDKKHNVYKNDAMTMFTMDFVGDYSLVVMLPNVAENQKPEEALAKVESTLNAAELRKMLEEAKTEQVVLSMPKFRIDFSGSLKDMLQKLSMKKAFSGEADFSGITKGADLAVSEIIQKAYIDVNEKGAEAAAATVAMMQMRAMMPQPEEKLVINVDRPFMYALVENTDKTALFVGRVVKF